MKKYIIALKELGLQDSDILNICKTLPPAEIPALFSTDYLSLQYTYNIDLGSYPQFNIETEVEKALLNATKILEECRRLNIKVVTVLNKTYPRNLRQIPTPPPVLYYKGRQLGKLHIKSIACVGTRNITDFGKNVINKLIPNLVTEGFTIISGLAVGTDAEAHQSCLNNNGTTVAVLAHGLDQIYPKSNTTLATNILANGGTLVSEYPPGTPVDKFRFVQRNRLISGLSKGTLIVECAEKSGTMHTARFTIKQGRPVFCPVPSVKSDSTSGLSYLLTNKQAIGIPTTAAYDIIVHGIGYHLKNKERLRKVKAANATSLINSLEITPTELYDYLQYNEETCIASVRVSRQDYIKYKECLADLHLTNRDIFNAMIAALVNKYKKETSEN